MAIPPPKLGEFSPGSAMDKTGVLHHQRHWVPDQRDAFIGWLRGEFAAANAIIDSLCQHLQLIGVPGEYDFVLGSIQQRRFSWNGVLHMQQYFSVAEVLFSLQQVLMRKQQQQMPSNGTAKGPMQQKTVSNPVADNRQRRDFSQTPRRSVQERPKGKVNVPPPPSDQNGLKEVHAEEIKDFSSEENSSSQVSSPTTLDPGQPEGNRQGEEQGEKEREHYTHANEIQESSRGKEMERDNSVEIVESGQKTEGQVCHRVFGEVKRAQLEHLATEILSRNVTGDPSCIRGALRTAAVDPGKRSSRNVLDLVHSIVDYLWGQGRTILSTAARPNYFAVHFLEEGKSISIIERDASMRPLYLISLLSGSCTVLGNGTHRATLEAGSVLKFEKRDERVVPYAVRGDQCKRVLVLLGIDESEKVGDEKAAPPPPPSSKYCSNNLGSGQQAPSSPSSPSTYSPSSSPSPSTYSSSSSSSSSSWQPASSRPGTGVYIPNSTNSGGSGKCDVSMRASIQDVR